MKPKIILVIATVLIIGCTTAILLTLAPRIDLPKIDLSTYKTKPGYYTVTKVSDGDTFEVNMDGRIEKVRLIGVDTPETVKPNSPTECYGKMASDYTKTELSGKAVRLEADSINQNRDRYDRLLRYAYLENGILFNAQLISEGYGFAYLSFPFTKAEEFRQLQVEAREQNKGLWSGNCTIEDQDGRYKTNTI
jgi:micrococcal nuclease